MLDRAGDQLAGGAAAAAAPGVTISAESFPGLCMGVSVLTSLTLVKMDMDGLSEAEAELLTNALLKNAQAWNLDQLVANPRAAAALDLGGAFISIMVPRIIRDAEKRKAARLAKAPASPDAALAAAA